MILVALLDLAEGTTLDAELPHLAADLGVAPYDARLLVAPGFPAVLLSTIDRERALTLLGALRSRGHAAAACDAAAIVSSAAMISLRRFQIADDAILGGDKSDTRLPFDDVLCLLRAWHRHSTASEGSITERKFDAQRAIVSGGLMVTKNVSRQITSKSEAREDVLYIFRRSTQTPFILRESGTTYAALGEALARSVHENYLTVVALLRKHAHAAHYDERLLAMKRVPEKIAITASGQSSSTIATSSESGMDVLAHFLALSYAKRNVEPYRQ